MALSPRVTRRERIETLCTEIDDLLLRYRGLPPGRAQDAITAALNARFEEIDELNEPHFFETPLGQLLAYATGVLCVLCGLFTGSYGTVTFGIFVLAVSAIGFGKSPSTSRKNVRTWRP